MTDSRIALQRLRGAGGHHASAAHAGTGTQVDDVIGAADRVLVVLDHDQGVAGRRQLIQRVEQHRVVARMQADGRLIEHVAHALQIRTELRGQADALRLAARERRRRAIERQVAQAHALQKVQPAGDLGQHIARDGALARTEPQLLEERAQLRDRQRGQLGDRAFAKAQLQRDRIEPRTVAGFAGLRRGRRSATLADHCASSPV